MLRNVTDPAYPEGSDPVILPSARKRGIPDPDILYAYHHPFRRTPGTNDMTIITGPGPSGPLEIGYVIADGQVLIAHAMPARKQYLPQPRRREKRR